MTLAAVARRVMAGIEESRGAGDTRPIEKIGQRLSAGLELLIVQLVAQVRDVRIRQACESAADFTAVEGKAAEVLQLLQARITVGDRNIAGRSLAVGCMCQNDAQVLVRDILLGQQLPHAKGDVERHAAA